MTIKQRKRRHTRRRAHAAGVSRAIGRPQPRSRPVPRATDIELRAIAADTLAEHAAAEVAAEREATQLEAALRLLTVAKLQLRCAADGVEYRAKDRKAELIAKIIAAPPS